MKLTKEKALEIAIELWEWLAETGKRKWEWGEWQKYGEMQDNCPFCEQADGCDSCPIGMKYGGCASTAFENWNYADNATTRKKYAKLFLEQLKGLKI